MRMFILENNYPKPAPETLVIKEFKAVWDRDKSKDKEVAITELAYIYYSSDYKSIYEAFPPDYREEQIIQDIMPKKDWKPDSLVKTACAKYRELQNSLSLRFLDAQKNAMESLIDYFNSVDWEDETSKGQPKYKVTDVTRSAKEAGGIISSLEKLEEKVKKEQAAEESRSRGGGQAGFFEG